MKNTFTFIVIYLIVVFLSSCSTPKNSYYFQTIKKDTTIQSVLNAQNDIKIKKTDKLLITFSSNSKEEDNPYNLGAMPGLSIMYEVNPNDGNIQVHKLGQVHAEGLTRLELKNKLQKDISPYLKDPIVGIKFSNHHVTVIGEVNAVKLVEMPDDKITIIDVLAACGDINPVATRKNILVFRETANGKQVKQINLEDHSIFNSPWYYLQADDVVYVAPDSDKVKQASRNLRRQEIYATVGVLISTIAILINIFRR